MPEQRMGVVIVGDTPVFPYVYDLLTPIRFATVAINSTLRKVIPRHDREKFRAIRVDGSSFPLDFEQGTLRNHTLMVSNPVACHRRLHLQFETWSASFILQYLDNFVKKTEVLNLLNLAGQVEGLGQFRVGFGQSDYGRFHIEREIYDQKELEQIRKQNQFESPMRTLGVEHARRLIRSVHVATVDN